jgi:hypothetical protein
VVDHGLAQVVFGCAGVCGGAFCVFGGTHGAVPPSHNTAVVVLLWPCSTWDSRSITLHAFAGTRRSCILRACLTSPKHSSSTAAVLLTLC